MTPEPNWHNPEKVPAEMLGEGWRFCTVEEIENPPRDAELWDEIMTRSPWRARALGSPYRLDSTITYRTRAPLPEAKCEGPLCTLPDCPTCNPPKVEMLTPICYICSMPINEEPITLGQIHFHKDCVDEEGHKVETAAAIEPDIFVAYSHGGDRVFYSRAIAEGLSSGHTIKEYVELDRLAASQAQVEELQSQLDNLTASEIHSCSESCQRPLCVEKRKVAELEEDNEKALDQLFEWWEGSVIDMTHALAPNGEEIDRSCGETWQETAGHVIGQCREKIERNQEALAARVGELEELLKFANEYLQKWRGDQRYGGNSGTNEYKHSTRFSLRIRKALSPSAESPDTKSTQNGSTVVSIASQVSRRVLEDLVKAILSHEFSSMSDKSMCDEAIKAAQEELKRTAGESGGEA